MLESVIGIFDLRFGIGNWVLGIGIGIGILLEFGIMTVGAGTFRRFNIRETKLNFARPY